MQKKQKYAENKPQLAKAVRKKRRWAAKKNKGGHQNRNKVGLQKNQRRTAKKKPKSRQRYKNKSGKQKPCSRPQALLAAARAWA